MDRAARLRAAIHSVTEALAAQRPVDAVLQAVVEEARRIADAGSAAFCLLAEGCDMLDFVAVAGENAAQIVGLRIRAADSLSEAVLASGKPVILNGRSAPAAGNLFGDPGIAESSGISDPDAREAVYGPRSAAIVPVVRGERLIGTLSALNKRGSGEQTGFDSDDVDTLCLLAEFAALALGADRTASAAREQARELDVLYEAARTVAGSLNVQQVMDSVLTAICTDLEYHHAILFLLNDEKTHLFIAADRGLTEDEREIQLSVESGIPARVLQSGQARLISDTDTETEFENISERMSALSAMVAPIRSRDDALGVILVTSLQRHAYLEEDLRLLTAVAMQAGIAIENAWLYESAQRQAEQAAALFDLSQHIGATFDIDRVLNFVADSVLNLLNVDMVSLLLHDPAEDRLVPRVMRRVDEQIFGAIRPRPGEGIAGWVYEWQTPQAVSDVAADARNRSAPIDEAGIASTLCVPMQIGDEVIGVIHAMSGKRRLFTVAEMELLYTIANQAAASIANARLYLEARGRSHEMRRYFRRIAHAIGSAMDERDLPRLLADLAVEIMRADRCAIYRLNGDDLHLQATSHFRAAASPDESIPLGQGLAGWVARRGQSLLVANLDADPRSAVHLWLRRERLSSYMAVPVKTGRRTVGVIEIYTVDHRDFTKEEAQILSTFVRRARIAESVARMTA